MTFRLNGLLRYMFHGVKAEEVMKVEVKRNFTTRQSESRRGMMSSSRGCFIWLCCPRAALPPSAHADPDTVAVFPGPLPSRHPTCSCVLGSSVTMPLDKYLLVTSHFGNSER